jgi:hypothetical protein
LAISRAQAHTKKKEHRAQVRDYQAPIFLQETRENKKRKRKERESAGERGKYASLLLIDLLIGGLKSQSVNVNKKYGPLDARTFLLGSLILFIDEQVAAPLFA